MGAGAPRGTRNRHGGVQVESDVSDSRLGLSRWRPAMRVGLPDPVSRSGPARLGRLEPVSRVWPGPRASARTLSPAATGSHPRTGGTTSPRNPAREATQTLPPSRRARLRVLDADPHLPHAPIAPRTKHLLLLERCTDRPRAYRRGERPPGHCGENGFTGNARCCTRSHTPASQSSSARCRSRA